MSAHAVLKPKVPLAWTAVMAATFAVTLVCCGWLIWSDVTAFDDGEVAFSAGIVLAMMLVVWAVLAPIGRGRYAGWWRSAFVVPVLIAGTLAITWSGVPGRIGWLISRDAMDHAATVCTATPAIESIGMYDFDHIERGPGGTCEFYFLKYYPGVRSGFIYIPGGERLTEDIDHKHVHLGGNWHYFKS